MKLEGVKIPNFKKTSRSDSYRITALGMSLLNLISNECDLQNIKIPNEEESIEI